VGGWKDKILRNLGGCVGNRECMQEGEIIGALMLGLV